MRFLLGALYGVWGLLVAFSSWLFGALSCDESCDPTTGSWRDDPDATQWDVLVASGLLGGLAALATMVFAVRGEYERALAAWGLSAAATALAGGLFSQAQGVEGGALALILLAGIGVGFGAVYAVRREEV